jgi:hypothetical protein
MIEYLIAAACGAIAAVAYPPVNDLAVRARDWLYGLFRSL